MVAAFPSYYELSGSFSNRIRERSRVQSSLQAENIMILLRRRPSSILSAGIQAHSIIKHHAFAPPQAEFNPLCRHPTRLPRSGCRRSRPPARSSCRCYHTGYISLSYTSFNVSMTANILPALVKYAMAELLGEPERIFCLYQKQHQGSCLAATLLHATMSH